MNMYCEHCHKWVMATEHISDEFRDTASGATRLFYVCPLCSKMV